MPTSNVSLPKVLDLKAAISEGIASLDTALDGDKAVKEIEEYMTELVAEKDRVAQVPA